MAPYDLEKKIVELFLNGKEEELKEFVSDRMLFAFDGKRYDKNYFWPIVKKLDFKYYSINEFIVISSNCYSLANNYTVRIRYNGEEALEKDYFVTTNWSTEDNKEMRLVYIRIDQ